MKICKNDITALVREQIHLEISRAERFELTDVPCTLRAVETRLVNCLEAYCDNPSRIRPSPKFMGQERRGD
jgi:hypothetical protein